MADVTVTSAEKAPDGTVSIQGSNFTQTTTTVQIDGTDTAFTFVSATELTADAPEGASTVTVTKNGVSASTEITDSTDTGTGTDTPTEPGTAPGAGEGISPEAPNDPRTFIAAQDSTTTPQTNDPTQSGSVSPQVDTNLEPVVPSVSYLDVDPHATIDWNLEGEGSPQIVIPPLAPSGLEAAPKAIAPGTWPSPIDGFRGAVAGVALVGLIPVGDEKTPYPTGAPLGTGKRFWLQNGYYKSATPT